MPQGRLAPYEVESPLFYPLRERLQLNADGNLNAGIVRVAEVIPVADVVNVNVVGVIPTIRPRLNKTEPESAVLEARISANHHWTADAEFMLTAEIGTEARVRNAAIASHAEPQCWH